MSFKEITKQLSKDFRLAFPDKKENYFFIVNGMHDIYLEKSTKPHLFLLYAPVCLVPDERIQETYRFLLETNLYGQKIDQNIFSIDERSNQIIMFHWFDERNTSYSSFLDHLKKFIQHLVVWEERIMDVSSKTRIKEENINLNIGIKI